jgi:hypothetical protein
MNIAQQTHDACSTAIVPAVVAAYGNFKLAASVCTFVFPVHAMTAS